MSRFQIFQVVPRSVRRVAPAIGLCVVLASLVAALVKRGDGAVAVLLYSVAGVVLGSVVTVWLLSVGYVYADARRRAMRPALWAALVVLFPHLLGFLLYFVLRQPLAVRCLACGQMASGTQRFCSWCGAAQAAPVLSTAVTAQTDQPGVTR